MLDEALCNARLAVEERIKLVFRILLELRLDLLHKLRQLKGSELREARVDRPKEAEVARVGARALRDLRHEFDLRAAPVARLLAGGRNALVDVARAMPRRVVVLQVASMLPKYRSKVHQELGHLITKPLSSEQFCEVNS